MTKVRRKLIQRLRKFDRLKVLHMLRQDDTTVAYYCLETDELVLFIDIALTDIYSHYKVWGKVKEGSIERFTVKLLSRVVLHELFHWCGLERSRICEYLALRFVWNKELAAVVSSWMYPREILPKTIGEINLKWESSEES